MRYFYKPDAGVVGDCIPYWYDGTYHIFYLRDYRDVDSHGPGIPWFHLTTTDFVHFEDLGEAIASGGVTDQDLIVGTGSVFAGQDGTHHMFYTGINPRLRTDDTHEQAVFHATSTDLIHWDTIKESPLVPDERLYERHDWRDPFVFFDQSSGLYRMLLAARTQSGPPNRISARRRPRPTTCLECDSRRAKVKCWWNCLKTKRPTRWPTSSTLSRRVITTG